MKILIDGDGCPVIDITIDVAKKFNIEVIIMCDTSHLIKKEGVEVIVISKGIDSVDFALLNKVNKGDVVVTQDYGLASMVLSKGGLAINQNGLIYNDNNIDQLLISRHISKQIRKSGGRTKGPKKRKVDNDIKFKENLIEIFNYIE
ncbi:YaiI/YqxD family protein [Romboutsia maritimum]|uniref:UPF0178 protein CHF27_008905 n=1 Tax=Romboutsia maritimum TaxID=2020948 RepID=A0A371ISC1_9FIRM|nr:YaiI/YqxD family protein [Romboutsia maritimum]RDY23355.1 YaiI/YqxD family protein [Romboutsia maritimum]